MNWKYVQILQIVLNIWSKKLIKFVVERKEK